MKRLFRFLLGDAPGREPEAARALPTDGAEASVLLQGRRISRAVVPTAGKTILDLADRSKVDWLSNCKRGTCARCRCLVSEGMAHLTAPSQAELERLSPEEIAAGYRLGCQARIASAGRIAVKHEPY